MDARTLTKERDHGFALIELLTVALVIGVLTAVGTPVYLKHRAKSDVESVRKDAEQAALALTGRLTGSGTLPATLNADNPSLWGYKASTANNRLVEYVAAEDRFRLCILNVATNPDAWAVYTSASEKVTAGTGTEPTGACDGDTSGPALAAEATRGPSTPIATPTPTTVPTITPNGWKCTTFTSSAGAPGFRNLDWAGVASANGYRVKEYRNGVLVSTNAVTGTSYAATNTAPDTWQYTVDARGPGFTGPCDAPVYTPPPPQPDGFTCITFTNTANGASQETLTWSAVANANGYRVKTYRNGTLNSTGIATGTTSIVVDDPAPDYWQWTVEARGPGFTNDPCPTPTLPVASCATDYTFNGPAWQPGSVQWTYPANATSARVYLINADNSETLLENNTTTNYTVLPAHVRDGRFKGVRIVPYNAAGPATGCLWPAITTYVLPCAMPYVQAVWGSANMATLNWYIVDGAESNAVVSRAYAYNGAPAGATSAPTFHPTTVTSQGASQSKYEYRVTPQSSRYASPSCGFVRYSGGLPPGGGGGPVDM